MPIVWRRQQDDSIALLSNEDHRQEARVILLDQQTKYVALLYTAAASISLHVSRYLAAIDQLKLIADEDNRERRIERFLDATSNPRQWSNAEYGMTVAMETPDTKRAKHLKEIYLLLRIPDLEVDERLDALLQLKAVVEEYPDKLCREILELVQREAELVARQIKGTKLQGCTLA